MIEISFKNNLPISAIFLLTSISVMFKLQTYVSKKNTNIPLYDHLHQNDKFLKFYNISDYVIYSYILSLFYFNNQLPKFLNLLSIIYLLRTFSFTITILPKPGKMKDKENTDVVKTFYNYITLKDLHFGHVNDLLYSGHTSFMHLYYLYLIHFNYISPTNGKILFIINFLLSLLNVLSRCHYSICILFAYITTTFIFQNLIEYV
jgi:hypothetical protein